jgi:putative glycerol-1-phosphate prenyltransferase
VNQLIYQKILQKRVEGQKALAVLIDPDKTEVEQCIQLVHMANECLVDFFFVGGSLITTDNLGLIIKSIKAHCDIPVLIFPGSTLHVDSKADALLFLSLISGRNPEFLIGQHVIAAPIIRRSDLEVISTGYILIDSGHATSVSYISNTTPIPHDKPSIAACTAMAGEMLGMKLIFLDSGSGAKKVIDRKTIGYVRKAVDCPLIVGGGIDSPGKAIDAFSAGADVVVIGNGIEKQPSLLIEVSDRIKEYNLTQKENRMM